MRHTIGTPFLICSPSLSPSFPRSPLPPPLCSAPHPSPPPSPQVYYRAKKQREREAKGHKLYNDGYDDENYDYKFKLGEVLNERYQVRLK